MSVHFDPYEPDFLRDPYPVYHRLRSQEPVLWSERFRSWFLLRHDDVVRFFRETRLSADRTTAAKFKGSSRPEDVRTLGSDPPEHTVVRTLLNQGLTPAVVEVAGRIDELVEELLDAMTAAVEKFLDEARLHGEVDLIREFAYPLPINVIAEMFAIPAQDRGRFQDWSHGIARGMDHFYGKGSVATRVLELGEYFRHLAAKRRKNPGDDLLSRLLVAEHQGQRLSEKEVVSLCSVLLFAGHETTVNLIGNGVLALLNHDGELQRLRDEKVSTVQAIEELLRYDSPAQMISRTAAGSFPWDGREIAPGDVVVALLGAANRDPEAFADPDGLDLERQPNPHVSFGLGIHVCPGAPLSRQEARVAVPALLRRFPRLRLAETPPTWRQTAVLRGLESFPVCVD